MFSVKNERKIKLFCVLYLILFAALFVLLFNVRNNFTERKNEIYRLNEKYNALSDSYKAENETDYISVEKLTAYILSCVKRSDCNLIKYSFNKEKNKNLLNLTLTGVIENINQFFCEMQKYTCIYKYMNFLPNENEIQLNLKVNLDEVTVNEKENINCFSKNIFYLRNKTKKIIKPKTSDSNDSNAVKPKPNQSNVSLVSKVLSDENEFSFWVRNSSGKLLFLENAKIEKDEKSQLFVLCENKMYLIKK